MIGALAPICALLLMVISFVNKRIERSKMNENDVVTNIMMLDSWIVCFLTNMNLIGIQI